MYAEFRSSTGCRNSWYHKSNAMAADHSRNGGHASHVLDVARIAVFVTLLVQSCGSRFDTARVLRRFAFRIVRHGSQVAVYPCWPVSQRV
jgi:hypothetical protein